MNTKKTFSNGFRVLAVVGSMGVSHAFAQSAEKSVLSLGTNQAGFTNRVAATNSNSNWNYRDHSTNNTSNNGNTNNTSNNGNTNNTSHNGNHDEFMWRGRKCYVADYAGRMCERPNGGGYEPVGPGADTGANTQPKP